MSGGRIPAPKSGPDSAQHKPIFRHPPGQPSAAFPPAPCPLLAGSAGASPPKGPETSSQTSCPSARPPTPGRWAAHLRTRLGVVVRADQARFMWTKAANRWHQAILVCIVLPSCCEQAARSYRGLASMPLLFYVKWSAGRPRALRFTALARTIFAQRAKSNAFLHQAQTAQ